MQAVMWLSLWTEHIPADKIRFSYVLFDPLRKFVLGCALQFHNKKTQFSFINMQHIYHLPTLSYNHFNNLCTHAHLQT